MLRWGMCLHNSLRVVVEENDFPFSLLMRERGLFVVYMSKMMVIVLVLAGVFFSLKKLLLSPVLGQDIEVDEEIIIVHEYATHEEADQAAAAAAINGNEYSGCDSSYLQAAAAAAAGC
jgi:hypothetical protein